MSKYRVKLSNGRIVGPVSKNQIGELFSKGHINGHESFQNFPAGDWLPLSDFEELRKILKDSITKGTSSEKKIDHGDSTIARIKVPAKSKPIINESKNIKSEEKLIDKNSDFNEFQFSKKTSTKIDYKELEEKYNENDSEDNNKGKGKGKGKGKDEGEDDGLEKTKLIRMPVKGPIDKTRVVRPKEILEEPIEELNDKTPENKKIEEGVDDVIIEEKVDTEEKTAFVNLKDLLPDLRQVATIAENEFEQKINPRKVKKKAKVENNVQKKPANKNKKILIAVGLLLLLFFMFSEDEKARSYKPVYVEFEFPRVKEKPNIEKSKKYLKQGMKLYIKGDYVSRVKASYKFLKSLRENYEGNLALGMLVRSYSELLPEAKNQEKAKKTLDRLIQVSRNKVLKDSNLTLGVSKFYAYLEKFKSAERTIENYLRLNKQNLDIFTYYLYILVENGDYEKAKRIYERLDKSKKKSPTTFFYMAYYLRANEEIEKQRNLLKKAVELRPTSVPLWLALSENLFSDGEYALLSKALDKIKHLKMERSPHYYSRYLEYRGMLRALNGNLDMAVKLLQKALKYHETNALRSKLAALRLQGSEAVQALIVESKIKEAMRKSRAFLRKKEWKKAFQSAIEAVDLNESYIPSQLLLAKIQTKRGFYESAIETTEFLKKEFPANSDTAYAYIKALMEAEKMDEANRVITTLSNSTNFFQLSKFQALIGYYWLKKNKFSIALRYFTLALKKDPLNDEYYFVLATEFFKRKRFKDANRYLSRCLDLDPDDIYFLSLQSNIIYEMDGADRAIGYLRDVLKDFPDHPKILGDIAVYYYRSGKTLEFKNYKAKIENLNKKDGDFYSFMIKASKVEDNDADVIFYSKKLIKTDPGNIKIRMTLGEFLLQTKRYREALVEFQEVKKRLATYPRINYNLARAYVSLRDYENALKFAKIEIKENPGLAYGYYIAGEVYRLTERFSTATPYFEKAISRNSKLVPALIGLGFIKYRNNLYEQARQFYLKAKREEPDNPEIHKQLGYIFNASGQSVLGAESFETYLRLAPGAPDKAAIEKYIRALR